MSKYLNHISIHSGHTRRSFLSEVDPKFLAQLGPIVEEAEREGTAELPTPNGLMRLRRLQVPGISPRECPVWTLEALEHNGAQWSHAEVLAHPIPLVIMGLCQRSRHSLPLWHALWDIKGALPHQTLRDRPPAQPWLAVLPYLHLIVPLYGVGPDSPVHWLGDFERCVAWAWLGFRE
jgi:hypothetical protein